MISARTTGVALRDLIHARIATLHLEIPDPPPLRNQCRVQARRLIWRVNYEPADAVVLRRYDPAEQA
jgi:hypothetical protein